MDAEGLVLSVLGALPAREIRGRKRLQKLAFFAVQTGAESNVRFFLYDFGPFSTEVAKATDFLAFVGDITEVEEQFGRAKRYHKVYRLTDPVDLPERFPTETSEALRALNEYSTIELEIASTIRYFMGTGFDPSRAIEETKRLKPSKSEPIIVRRATEALSKVGLYERRRTDQVSSTRSDQL